MATSAGKGSTASRSRTAEASSYRQRWTRRGGKPSISEARTETLQPQAVISMGDKSPKAKDKAKKQDAADKNQKKAAAVAKASQASAWTAKKGK
jgi:hypothetical protein